MRSPFSTCRRAVRGADPTEEAEEAAGGGNGPHVHGGPRRHAAAGSSHAGSTAARDDREAGGHAETVQQEVLPGAAQSHGECLALALLLRSTLLVCLPIHTDVCLFACVSGSHGLRVTTRRTERFVSSASPTSPSWPSCQCRRLWILPNSFLGSWSSPGKTRSPC